MSYGATPEAFISQEDLKRIHEAETGPLTAHTVSKKHVRILIALITIEECMSEAACEDRGNTVETPYANIFTIAMIVELLFGKRYPFSELTYTSHDLANRGYTTRYADIAETDEESSSEDFFAITDKGAELLNEVLTVSEKFLLSCSRNSYVGVQ